MYGHLVYNNIIDTCTMTERWLLNVTKTFIKHDSDVFLVLFYFRPYNEIPMQLCNVIVFCKVINIYI